MGGSSPTTGPVVRSGLDLKRVCRSAKVCCVLVEGYCHAGYEDFRL